MGIDRNLWLIKVWAFSDFWQLDTQQRKINEKKIWHVSHIASLLIVGVKMSNTAAYPVSLITYDAYSLYCLLMHACLMDQSVEGHKIKENSSYFTGTNYATLIQWGLEVFLYISSTISYAKQLCIYKTSLLGSPVHLLNKQYHSSDHSHFLLLR